jgi:DNA invertase Pin-like site-specific DNA recombinase
MTRASKTRAGDAKTAIAYLRVSKEEQSLGPEAQRSAISAWALRENVRVVAWETDQGITGGAEDDNLEAALRGRPALQRALGALRGHNAGIFVVAKRDRLARNVALARMISLIVRKSGAAVRSADGMSDLDGPEGAMMQGIVDVFSEYERAIIRARTRAALAAKKARGESTGQAPFGTRAVGPNGKLVPQPRELAVVETIVRLRAGGATERGIATELEARGFRSRTGEPFCQTQVHRILTRVRELGVRLKCTDRATGDVVRGVVDAVECGRVVLRLTDGSTRMIGAG